MKRSSWLFLLISLTLSFNLQSSERPTKFFLECIKANEKNLYSNNKFFYRFNNSEGLVHTFLINNHSRFEVVEKVYSLQRFDNKTYKFSRKGIGDATQNPYAVENLLIDRASLKVSSQSLNNYNLSFQPKHSCKAIPEFTYWNIAPQRPKNKI